MKRGINKYKSSDDEVAEEYGIQEYKPLNAILYMPLDSQDPYKACVRFICAAMGENKRAKDREILRGSFFDIPTRRVNEFLEVYDLTETDLRNFMTRPNFLNDIRAENKIKLEVGKIGLSSLWIDKAYEGDSVATAAVLKLTEEKVATPTQVNITLSESIKDRLQSRMSLYDEETVIHTQPVVEQIHERPE